MFRKNEAAIFLLFSLYRREPINSENVVRCEMWGEEGVGRKTMLFVVVGNTYLFYYLPVK